MVQIESEKEHQWVLRYIDDYLMGVNDGPANTVYNLLHELCQEYEDEYYNVNR